MPWCVNAWVCKCPVDKCPDGQIRRFSRLKVNLENKQRLILNEFFRLSKINFRKNIIFNEMPFRIIH